MQFCGALIANLFVRKMGRKIRKGRGVENVIKNKIRNSFSLVKLIKNEEH